MTIWFHDAALNPAADSWPYIEVEENAAKQMFTQLSAPGSFVTALLDDYRTLNLTLESPATWTVELAYSRTGKWRGCAVNAGVALVFLEAAFQGNRVEALADNLQMDWHDIPAETGYTVFHPGRSHLEENGSIIVTAGGSAPGIGIWDGRVVFERLDPDYRFWLWIRSQPKWQAEDSSFTDQDIESMKRDFAASQHPHAKT